MNKQNLDELFKLINIDTPLKRTLRAIQIIYLYYIIRDWYINDKVKVIPSFNYEIADDMERLSDMYNEVNGKYISLVYNQFREQMNDNDNSCIHTIEDLEANMLLTWAIHIRSDNNIFIVLIFHVKRQTLLIDTATLNILEFKNIRDCISYIDAINTKYTYHLLRVVNRFM